MANGSVRAPDLWLDGKFAGALNSRTLSDLAPLSREELY